MVPDSWRIKNANDLVSRIPSLLGYQHIGTEVQLLFTQSNAHCSVGLQRCNLTLQPYAQKRHTCTLHEQLQLSLPPVVGSTLKGKTLAGEYMLSEPLLPQPALPARVQS